MFSYDVFWEKSDIEWSSRWDAYLLANAPNDKVKHLIDVGGGGGGVGVVVAVCCDCFFTVTVTVVIIVVIRILCRTFI